MAHETSHTDCSSTAVDIDSFAQSTLGKTITSDLSQNMGLGAHEIGPDNCHYYVGGYGTSSPAKLYVVKSDTAGNIIWEKTISTFYDLAAADISVDENSIYISGMSWIAGFIMRLDTAGNFLWQRNIQAFNYISIYSVESYTDGGCVFAGRAFVQPQVRCGIMARLDSTGNVLWSKEFHWDSIQNGELSDVTIDNAGNIYACGIRSSMSVGSVGTMIKLSPDGNTIWSKFYTAGINFTECIFTGDALLVGARAYGTPNSQVALLKLDTSGNFLTGIVFTDSTMATTLMSLTTTPHSTYIAGIALSNTAMECMVVEIDNNLNILRGLQHPDMQMGGVATTTSHIYLSGTIGNLTRQYQRVIADYAWNIGCGFVSANPPVQSISLQAYNLTDSIAPVVITQAPGITADSIVQISFTVCDNLAGIPDPLLLSPEIYPNPTAGTCTIVFPQPMDKPSVFELSDITGKTVRSCNVTSGVQTMDLDLSDLPDGIYFLKSKDGFVAKIVVAH